MELSFVDLFCGAGGFTEGLRAAGLQHLGGVDVDRWALASYRANHGVALSADARKLAAAGILKMTGGRRPDVLAASPPCQSISAVGRTAKMEHANDTLFEEAIRVAVELRCRAVLVENVSTFASKLGKDAATV